MKISIDYKEQKSSFDQLKIDSAKYLSDFAIRLNFSDGANKVVDFKPFLLKSLKDNNPGANSIFIKAFQESN